MFTKIVSGERHVVIIGNYKDSHNNLYYVSEWKLDGARISLSSSKTDIKQMKFLRIDRLLDS